MCAVDWVCHIASAIPSANSGNRQIAKPPSTHNPFCGQTTSSSMQAGLYYGYIGLVDGILRRMLAELGDHPRVVATGGLAKLIGRGSEFIEEIDEDLPEIARHTSERERRADDAERELLQWRKMRFMG